MTLLPKAFNGIGAAAAGLVGARLQHPAKIGQEKGACWGRSQVVLFQRVSINIVQLFLTVAIPDVELSV